MSVRPKEPDPQSERPPTEDVSGDVERAALVDESDELLAALRAGLRAEPLSPALRQRILADLNRRCASARRHGLPPIHLVWLAAAACLMAAVVLPPRSGLESTGSPTPLSLSPSEAAEIVAAYGLLSWDSPADYTLEAVDASLRSIEGTLRREAGSSSLLPWGSDDDWDVPATNEESPSQSRATSGAVCSATWDGQLGASRCA